MLVGMRFHQDKSGHWLPIIVQGDPSKPRAKPSVSVMDIKQRVKKDALLGAGLTIEEEEAHDVKNDIVQVRVVFGSKCIMYHYDTTLR